MHAILPDLWETEVEHPAPGLTTHAYLLVRPQGNILFYNTSRAYKPVAWMEAGNKAGHTKPSADHLNRAE